MLHASRYVERVTGGESIEIAVRGRLVARLVPTGEGTWDAVLSRLNMVALSHRLLDEAGTLGPRDLRTLDAIHLAAARTAPALRALTVTAPGGARQVR